MTFLSHLYCARCSNQLDHKILQNLCPCGAPLLVAYDTERLKAQLNKSDLTGSTLWRYRDFLPLEDNRFIVSLGEGMTPIVPAPQLGSALGIPNLSIKDEGLNPTGTFKARGAAVGVSRAKELGASVLALPTAGNAGGAWSTYAARAGLRTVVAMPEDAPEMTKAECYLSGAETFLVRGLISDAGRLIGRASAQQGWFEVTTLKEPYRIEGKKTMGLEIAEQFDWDLPDVIIYPVGGGVGIIGIWKAFNELREMGWIGDRMPRLVVVQSDGCAPIVEAFEKGAAESEFWSNAQTIAGGLRVPKALGDFLVLQALRETGGAAVAVPDSALLEALQLTFRKEGVFLSPEGAATVAAAERLIDSGYIAESDRVVLLNTATGLKYPNLFTPDFSVLNPESELSA